MPNGGSDCCGTCWFNSKNEGEPGSHGYDAEGVVECVIRDIKIVNPFWTYCANHPHHNQNKIDVPLGPVYISDGYPYSRKIWIPPPDNEMIRVKLLEILESIDAALTEKYPLPIDFEEAVISHITAIKEERALPILLKITQLDIRLVPTEI